jgi:hypothetical protein
MEPAFQKTNVSATVAILELTVKFLSVTMYLLPSQECAQDTVLVHLKITVFVCLEKQDYNANKIFALDIIVLIHKYAQVMERVSILMYAYATLDLVTQTVT